MAISKPKSTPSPIRYAVHPSIAHSKKILDNLPKTTGHSLAEWIRQLKKSGVAKTDIKAQRAWLIQQSQMGTMQANMIVDLAWGGGRDYADPVSYLADAPGYIEAMYEGKKALLRPVYDKLISLALTLGPELKICPCKTIVPLYRNHVFAQIKPTTLTRIDLGLALKDCRRKLPHRIMDTGGLAKKDRITHRIALSHLNEVDDFVANWMSHAFSLDESPS